MTLTEASQACASCGSTNPTRARFCNQCGSGFAQTSADIEAERRQLTVMFADLVGSTTLSNELDAEDFRDVIREYWALCGEVVRELDGHIQQHLGDGVMAYFGHPRAHEDDPRRATEAGLRILERLPSLSARLHLAKTLKLQARIGVHTGITVVGREGVALGKTPNLAARLEQLAAPDSLVISEATRKLVDGYFRCDDLGPQQIKGLADPITVHRVLGSTGVRTRVQAVGERLTPLVGRERETAQLEDAWRNVVGQGKAHLVTLVGEAGMGKTRLVQVLRQAAQGGRVVDAYCSPLHENTALRPLAQALEAGAAFEDNDSVEQRLSRLQSYLGGLGLDGETVALLAPVVGLPVPGDSAVLGLSPPVRRHRTLQAIAHWLKALASSKPLLVVIEDAHWADPSTQQFLQAYWGGLADVPALLLVTCRPELPRPWEVEGSLSIEVTRLGHELAEAIVNRVASGQKLPPAVRERVVALTDGVPLYLEEVTRAIVDSGALRLAEADGDSLPDNVVPPSVHDSLTARLDRLGSSKSIAQLAAVLGREFAYEVLRAIALVDDAELNGGLRALLDAGLLTSEESADGQRYRFKHALIQETAYQSLIKSRRRQYHHRVASVLLDQFPSLAEAQPGVIAQHHAQASLPKLAALHFERAGDAAFLAQAYVESINHHQSALGQIAKLPTGKERDGRELQVLAGLGLPLLMTQGYAAPAVASTYERALALCSEVDPPLRILFGVWGAQLVRGDLSGTAQLAARFHTLAEATRLPAERLIAHNALGSYAFFRGELARAVPALQAGVREYEPAMLATLPRDYGYDNALWGHLYLTWALYAAGRLDEAKKAWNEVWSIVEAARVPYLTVMALSFGAVVARELGDHARARELAERGLALSTEHQLAFWQALAKIQLGGALCVAGELAAGTELIEHGLGFCRIIGVMTPFNFYLPYLVDAHHRAGRVDAALEVVAEGLRLAESHVDRSGLVELLRLKGELLFATDWHASAAAFEEALKVARAQGAALWEVRAALSYAGRLRERGDTERARACLHEAVVLLQGGDAPVVREAQALLSELKRG